MKRWDVVQYLIDKNNFKSYLEIGVRRCETFNKVECDIKIGVDPNGRGTHKMKSDEFFLQNNNVYDIIFIDGLHIDEQVTKDIKNSLSCLSKGGAIVMHDCNPLSVLHQQVPRVQKVWNGTVWKSFVRLRCTNPNLEMYVVDTDWGCGVIERGEQELYKEASLKRCLKWNYFKINRKELLNLITVYEFKRRLK
jgi:hypothetical protein